MKGFFNDTSSGVMDSESVNNLQKALTAGYGTDSASFTGGRALIPENLESEVINALAESKEDCKMMNSMKKSPVKSTVHEVNLRTDRGDWKHTSVAEGGSSLTTDQSLNRKTFEMKYLQTRRSVTKQMEAAETFEGALASEKIAGVETIIKGAEYQCFHGNSKIEPTEFDGFLSSIKNAASANQNITSLRGATISSVGESLFDNIAEKVYNKGGWLEKAVFPPVLAKEIKEMFDDKARYIMNQNGNGTMNQMFRGGIPNYETAIGASIALSGDDCGADKFFQVKGSVSAEGSASLRPAAPASVTATVNSTDSNSEFTGDFADGDYTYTVHAVNQYGISEGTAIDTPVTVAEGASVTLEITPGSGVSGTGYIICRSAKDGTTVMEMDSVADSGDETTTYTDTNAELPGTASMILLPKLRQNYYSFGQLLPACTFPLAPTASAETPFLVLLFGALELRTPQFCGLIKDIHYNGGLY